MKVVDLTGKEREWKVKGYPAGDGHRVNSNLHKLGREAIRAVFPTIQFKEEVPIPVDNKKTLFLDFYLPIHRIAVEVHGKQHFAFSLHFHQTRAGFIQYKQRDQDKADWCSINNIKLVVLPENEDFDEWKRRLQSIRRGENEDGDGGSG